MLRLISFLIFLAGLAAAALGAIVYFNIDIDRYIDRPAPEMTTVVHEGEPELVEAIDVPAASDEPLDIPTEMAAAEDVMAEEALPELVITEQDPAAPAAKAMKTVTTAARSLEPVLGPEGLPLDQGFDESPSPEPIVEAAPELSPHEAFMNSLRTVPIAHQSPRSAELRRPFDVVLSIDSTGDDDATDSLSDRGVIETGQVQVSDRVQARLIGANFQIQASSPETQRLSPTTENVWRWSVTPLVEGEHDLSFEIYAVEGDDITPLRTFKDSVTVEVTGLSMALELANQANPLFVLLGGIGSALGGLWATLKFFSRK